MQRRITLAICLIIGITLLVSGGLTFLVTPLAQDLGLSEADVDDMLAIPSVAALIVVFSARHLADRLGSRRTLILASLAFSAGSAVVASASTAVVVEIGLAICSAAAVTVQIVGVSTIQRATGDGPAQVSAFTLLGAVFPFAFLVLPVATGLSLQLASWRLVPVVWMVAGFGMVAIVMLMLRADSRQGAVGDWATPLLAGIAFASGARAVAELDDIDVDPTIIGTSVMVGLVAGVACYVLVRRSSAPGFTTRPIRARQIPLLLVTIGLVTFIALLTFVTIAVEYLYDMTPYEASVAVIPTQVGAIVGARFVARHAIRWWGGVRAARVLMLALAASTLPLTLLSVGSPLWFLIIVATVFSCAWMAVLTVLNAEVMRRAPEEDTGAVSAFRTAASSLGTALGVGIFGAIVLSHLPMGNATMNMTSEQLLELTNSLRLDGLLATVGALVAWGVLRAVRHQPQAVSV